MPQIRRSTSRNYARPRRPALIRAYNQLARARSPAASGLELNRLLDAARQNTGRQDFGDPYFLAPLEVLLDSIAREARLNPLGRVIMTARIRGILENRLRIEALTTAHAEIEQTCLERPLVIAGLQRTGTTLLHRLLAADPRARALLGWEALHPAPLDGEGRTGSFRRRALGKLGERTLSWLAPELFAIHPVESDAAEEDVLLLDHCFTSQAPEATLHVPSYAAWLEEHDLLPAYRYLARILKLLLWQRPGEFWVLKTPHHMEYLKELRSVFPNAIIVQTHRDPQATMGSFCSMVAHGRGLFSDHVDPREVGRHWLRKVRRMIDRSLAEREQAPDSAFVDVSYYDLVGDPLREVRRIYACAGLELTESAEAAMRRVLARNVQHRHGRHSYDARDFGLSSAAIEDAFADYRRRFEIRHERPAHERSPSQTSGPTGLGHRTALSATLTALIDLAQRSPSSPLPDSVRLDGSTALVTGANSGLGKAVAINLARRGARVLLACRSGIPDAGRDVARISGSDQVEMLPVDLSDLDSVVLLTKELERRRETLDIVVCNAGLVLRNGQRSRQGYDVMWTVHYLANHLLLRRLLASGVLPNDVFADNGRHGERVPRVVFVVSEAHRSSTGIDFEHLAGFEAYGPSQALLNYANSKLGLVTFATELARRLTIDGRPSVAVHALCPGAVASGIARDAPTLTRPLVDSTLKLIFPRPEQAAPPVIYLAAAPELSGETGWYLHLMQRKGPSAAAVDRENGRRLWARGEAMLAEWIGHRHQILEDKCSQP
jgi:NAD(P)-dependent dehydrogenase (short-subunit alcohol dehydrogenase family)